MDLLHLRAFLRQAIHEDGQGHLTDEQLDYYINAAMQHVANWILSLEADFLLTQWSGSTSNAGDERIVIQDLSAATYPIVRRLVAAERHPWDMEQDGDDPTVEIVSFDSVKNIKQGAASARPKVFLYNQTFGFLRPQNNLGVRITYAHGLPDMTQGSDTPGQAATVGDANKFPLSFQPLIVSFAAVLVTTGENSPSNPWWAVYSKQQEQLVATLPRRPRTQQRG